jgi:hypothetical protein
MIMSSLRGDDPEIRNAGEAETETFLRYFKFESMLCKLLQLLFEHTKAHDRLCLALFIERCDLFEFTVENAEKPLLRLSEPRNELVQG